MSISMHPQMNMESVESQLNINMDNENGLRDAVSNNHDRAIEFFYKELEYCPQYIKEMSIRYNCVHILHDLGVEYTQHDLYTPDHDAINSQDINHDNENGLRDAVSNNHDRAIEFFYKELGYCPQYIKEMSIRYHCVRILQDLGVEYTDHDVYYAAKSGRLENIINLRMLGVSISEDRLKTMLGDDLNNVAMISYLTSWLKDIENGDRKEWYENGQIKTQQYVKNGKKCGKWETWYENGYMKSQCFYKNGKLSGEWTQWNENGELKSQRFYKKK
jgi:hypothetical protein